mmetsp:Transcript_20262/g.58148  ORF Transcript_20262/g.58148 Transcript_20262/m.58148 type:complete len:89 (-) Transcript_20262:533-799(-)
MLASCRRALEDDGAMILPAFAIPDGLQRLKAEVLACPYTESRHHYTPFQDQGDHISTNDQDETTRYPPSHPRYSMMRSSAALTIALAA